MSAPLDEDYEIYQLLYCSLAARALETVQMAQLLDTARTLNKMDHITGVLMVHDGIYVQWLEGPKEAVLELWGRLQRDPRHHCVVKLLEHGEVEERSCPQWSMREVSRDELLAIVNEAEAESARTASPWGNAIHVLNELLHHTDTHHYITQRHAGQSLSPG